MLESGRAARRPGQALSATSNTLPRESPREIPPIAGHEGGSLSEGAEVAQRDTGTARTIAFVLSGGGNLGALQVGMLRALLADRYTLAPFSPA